ncbi:MAG: T9SS type A sorting domain-containing protein, partial [bacterium]
PDSLACRMVDWLDADGASIQHGPFGGGDYYYSGTCLWDMAMGDSFLVWLPGTDIYYFVNPFSQTEVETVNSFDYGSENVKGIAIKDSICFLTGGPGIVSKVFESDSLRRKDLLIQHFASFHYAVIRDTFLYTASTGSYGLHCINIANPETIFVAWTYEFFFGECGLAVAESSVFIGGCGAYTVSPPDDWHWRTSWIYKWIDLTEDPISDHYTFVENAFYGDIDSHDDKLFHVYTEVSDYIEGVQDYTLGDSHLGIWGTDFSYTWEDYDSEGVFGVEVLNDTILAVGFEHGISIINYTQLGGMVEVAYYRDTDSIFCFTHFARKDNRLYAMAHPREGICRMYMFEIDEGIWSGIAEARPKPLDFQFRSYPNPFNSECKFVINADNEYRDSRLEIFDITGRTVYTKNMRLMEGSNILIWSPENASSGVYLARIVAGEMVYTAKLVYMA